MRTNGKILFFSMLLIAFGQTASAATKVTLSPASLHPNLSLTATGAGFGD